MQSPPPCADTLSGLTGGCRTNIVMLSQGDAFAIPSHPWRPQGHRVHGWVLSARTVQWDPPRLTLFPPPSQRPRAECLAWRCGGRGGARACGCHPRAAAAGDARGGGGGGCRIGRHRLAQAGGREAWRCRHWARSKFPQPQSTAFRKPQPGGARHQSLGRGRRPAAGKGGPAPAAAHAAAAAAPADARGGEADSASAAAA